jgi:tRNA(Arg) A34 adenosine deaminase TadA
LTAWAPAPWEGAVAGRLGPGAAFLPVGDEVVGIVAERPVLALAMAAWEAFPGRAHAALRARIRSTSVVTALDRAVAQVAAKRVVQVAAGPGAVRAVRMLGPELSRADARIETASWSPPDERPDDVVAYVRALVPEPEPVARAVRDRPVAAVLLDRDGRVRWAGRNAGAENRVLHAELVLLLSWHRAHGPVPDGWQLATSLQPCRMCAALAVALAAGRLGVGYVEADPGRLAQGTALQVLGWERAL